MTIATNSSTIVFFIFLFLFIVLIAYYNSVVKLHNQVKETFSGIDVALSKRFALIPNLVQTVKAYAKHEASVFESIAQNRSAPLHEQSEKASSTINQLLALSENYPDLKADAQFLNLQRNLSDTEEHLQAARRLYNRKVSQYNTKIQQFPANLIAQQLKYTPASFFEASAEEQASVHINL